MRNTDRADRLRGGEFGRSGSCRGGDTESRADAGPNRGGALDRRQMTRTRVSRTRQLRPLSKNLPQTARTLLEELRALKDRSGYDFRALEGKTYASRSSWGRWLSGE